MADEFNFSPLKVEWNQKHAEVLSLFLKDLELYNVKYIILKNHEGLPLSNFSKDVDILIEPGKYKIAANLLYQVFKSNDVSYYRVHQFEKLRCWYGFNPIKKFAIHIDLLEGFLHKGFELFSFNLFYEHAYKNKQGIFVLDEVYDAVILLLHSTICYHSIKEKYATKITDIYISKKDEIQKVLIHVLGNRKGMLMIKLIEENKFDEIAKLGKTFSYASKFRTFKRKPFFTILNIIDFISEKFNRLILCNKKYNCFISVHAPDGTGKTTFIKEFAELLGFFFICNPQDFVDIHHFRPNILPNLGALGEKTGVMKQDTDFSNPHRAKPVGFLPSFIRMTYYWMDYLVGMPLILRKSAQFNKVVIFDRYIYDFITDPQRTRLNLPYWLRLLFSKLVKQSNLSFVLSTSSDIIYQRKQELTLDEIDRQLNEFNKLLSSHSRFYQLDASKTPKSIAMDAFKILCDKNFKKIGNE